MGRLLVLGGTVFQIPAITEARSLGHRVITCDYLPSNPGHRLADEYYDVSTTDIDGVKKLARRLHIDGILAFASDPAATTAASVAAELGLPGSPPEAINTLRCKPHFRKTLERHGFRTPRFAVPADTRDALGAADALGYPVMVKPSDSSGSKGVSKVDDSDALPDAFSLALSRSLSGTVIIEQFVPRRGRQIAGDGLVVDGRVVFLCIGDEHFDLACSAHAPVGESFPAEIPAVVRSALSAELARLFGRLGIRDLVFNLDAMVDTEGRIMLIEVGPRAGGNFLPQVIQRHTGVDLTNIAVRQALGDVIRPAEYSASPQGFHASWVVHSRLSGRLAGIHIDDRVKPFIHQLEWLAPAASSVEPFRSSSDALGYAICSFPDRATMDECLVEMPGLIAPIVTPD